MKRRLEILREVGILDETGSLAEKYISPGDRVSRAGSEVYLVASQRQASKAQRR